MMKKIKVYLQRPWRFADSPYYQYLLGYPPKGIEYIGQTQKEGTITNKNKFLIVHWTKQKIKRILRLLPFSIPNAHFTKTAKRYDLIHCAHCLSWNKRPWIADIEYVDQFLASGKVTSKNKKTVEKILKDKYCKKILAWTKWSAKGILDEFPEIKEKVEVVYPGVPLQKFKKIKTEKIRLLFLSRRFYFKGGLYAVEVMNRLTKKYDNIEGIIVSDTPPKIVQKYGNNPKVKFYPLLPQKKVFREIYPQTDIFVYPSFTDSFGFTILEAMAFGIPIVGIRGHCNDELVEQKKIGFLVGKKGDMSYKNQRTTKGKEKILNELEEKTEKLIKDKKLREKMSKAAVKEVSHGKFSIEKRNKKIERIYREALK